MALTPGTRLGPYQIVGSLGAGGMGEVYRARDTRLGRDVAIKTLPAAFAQDPDRRTRFETETQAIAALSHPNVLAIHDIGTEGETVFAVMELVEGQTLRELLADGPLSGTRAAALAIQIANGLGAAHDRGVIHRDLKPENVIVTPDGQAKILDFGLAKRVGPAGEDSQTPGPTLIAATEPGMVLGTVGYMSPEQVRGQPADARSDIFALGALLYEMVSGQRAFRAASPAETMTAILREEPRELTQVVPGIPPAIERIVRRCLEKAPSGRFRSVADLAYALEAVSSGSGATAVRPSPSGATVPAHPGFMRITHRNGFVVSARFLPDGAGVAFSAMWEGRASEIFTSHPGSPGARHLGLPQGSLLAISTTGELAISIGHQYRYFLQASGTLARVGLAGGGVRQMQKDVGYADWSPDGRTLALIRFVDRRCRLEYPAGKLLLETPEWMSLARVSPDGRQVAFAYHALFGDSTGEIRVIDPSGAFRVLIRGMTDVSGIAWSPGGEEVWCSGIDEQNRHGIWAFRSDGTRRQVHASAGRVTLHDIARDGRVLMSARILRIGLNVGGDPGGREADLSWFDGSLVTDLSADGRQILSCEVDEAENPRYASYLRDVDGSPAVRIGDGIGFRLSSDGAWVTAMLRDPEHGLVLHPTGIGETRSVALDGIERLAWAALHPDGKRVFVVGSGSGQPNRLHLLSIDGGTPRLLWDEEVASDWVTGVPLSPDGERLVLRRVSGESILFSCTAGAVEPIRGLVGGEHVICFDASGRSLYVANGAFVEQQIDLLDLETGERTRWRALEPPDPTGITYVSRPVVAANGSRYAYSFLRMISDLYLVDGFR